MDKKICLDKSAPLASKCSTLTNSVESKTKNVWPPCKSSSSIISKISSKKEKLPKDLFCENVKGKDICERVERLPPFKVKKPVECHPMPKERSYMKTYREGFCPEELAAAEKSLSECICVSSLSSKPHYSTQRVPMKAIRSTGIESSVTSKLHWKHPCKGSDFDEADDYYFGRCTKEQKARAPPKRRNWVAQFRFTEDPRRTQCLKNPQRSIKVTKPELRWKEITEKIKLIENVDTSSSSEGSGVICVETDLDNPAGLDFQKWDYRENYFRDEQNIQDGKEYLMQKRYADRKILHDNIAEIFENKEYDKKVTVPKIFDTNVDYNVDGMELVVHTEEIAPPAETKKQSRRNKLAMLFRTRDKSWNKSIIEIETDTRFGRYYNLHQRKVERQREQAAIKEAEDRANAENRAFILAEDDFNKDHAEERANEIQEKYDALHKVEKRKWYPHNLDEVKKLRQNMKRYKNIVRDQAVIQTEFYKELGVDKKLNEANLEISPKSSTISTKSEQSTNDEDAFEVGFRGSNKFYLRGHLFKLGTEPRGQLHITQKRKEGRALRTCQTRNEWFLSLVPKTNKQGFSERKQSSTMKPPAPDDPKIRLFAKGPPSPVTYDTSAVREFVEAPMGLQYKKGKKKNLRIKKPKTLKVKKFNLTGYLFGAAEEREKAHPVGSYILTGKSFGKLDEYLYQRRKKENLVRIRKKRQRMRYLGIPLREQRFSKKKTPDQCINSESEESDWIPEPEPITNLDKLMEHVSTVKINRTGNAKIIGGPVLHFNHMPAPQFREPTLKRHPRQPRELTDDLDPENANWSEIPRLEYPPDDKIVPYNLKLPKTKYTKLFDARHHHPHFNPTQHKNLVARYKSIVPEIEIVKESEQIEKRKKRTFEKAMPQGPNPGKFIDRTIPELPPIVLKDQDPSKIQKRMPTESKKAHKIIVEEEKSYGYKKEATTEFVGKKAYLKLIKDMQDVIKKRLANVEKEVEAFVIDKDAYVKELEDDLESIKSCVSTINSSICTNFTNDSGSFVMIQDTKLPLDFIRKSLVPFEEINRVRIKLKPLEINQDDQAPFAVVPYAGQKLEQRRIYKGDVDKFFTFNTRMRNGLRRRLEIPDDPKRRPFENDHDKGDGESATEAPFKVKTTMLLVKEALRKKFEICHMHSQLVEQSEAAKREDEYADGVMKMEALFTKLFNRWQKSEYDRSMSKVRVVKMYYEATHYLKKQLGEVEKKYIKLNMRIVFTESDWVRRTILQNFHYLLMKTSWREQHDWIHKKEDDTLEDYRESIEKRKYVNIRVRDRDDAWAIKEFYENHYLKNKHPIVIVHPDAQSFVTAVLKLKARTFVCLLELHYTLWILTNLQRTHRNYVKWSEEFVQGRAKFVKGKCAKKYFMEEREEKLKVIALELLENPLKHSISGPKLRHIKAQGDIVYNHIFPGAGTDKVRDEGIVEKVSLVFDRLLELIAKFEPYPSAKVKKIERGYRKHLKYRKRISAEAYNIERRINLTAIEIKKNMAPPYQKPKRVGKLPRGVLRTKPKIIPKAEKRVSSRTLFFHKAFVPDGEEASIKSEDLDKLTMSNIQDTCIPFYFDHFLRMNNYEPNYNFKTQVELMYGPEDKAFKYKHLLPVVYQKLEAWETMNKKQEQEDIAKTIHLYKDTT